ncbi:hypothetical protein E5676_scaffold98G001500 [Cucumis melo var. makuwa]|uniref:Uncharacterized protein n=1 Tax=Cucumis melo var. makuwa TaxID=1194695 RepID=A0A5D3C5K3_CUCMM|nr:hypothetical protein E6C27_scaffold262G002170 [Cucumis melo var. makuwa]TYK05679.1 hypothetical protein E5676_scaffold98G001500 [Cucumis melo var. makuwa]
MTAPAQATFYQIVAYFTACWVEIEAALELGEKFHKFVPIPDRQCWPDLNFLFIYPDETTIRSADRPCTSWIHNEMDRRDTTTPSRYTVCRQEGHNRRKCPKQGGNEA